MSCISCPELKAHQALSCIQVSLPNTARDGCGGEQGRVMGRRPQHWAPLNPPALNGKAREVPAMHETWSLQGCVPPKANRSQAWHMHVALPAGHPPCLSRVPCLIRVPLKAPAILARRRPLARGPLRRPIKPAATRSMARHVECVTKECDSCRIYAVHTAYSALTLHSIPGQHLTPVVPRSFACIIPPAGIGWWAAIPAERGLAAVKPPMVSWRRHVAPLPAVELRRRPPAVAAIPVNRWRLLSQAHITAAAPTIGAQRTVGPSSLILIPSPGLPCCSRVIVVRGGRVLIARSCGCQRGELAQVERPWLLPRCRLRWSAMPSPAGLLYKGRRGTCAV
jgi:hypothetical protein